MSTATATPYADYLLDGLAPTVWGFVTAHLTFLATAEKVEIAQAEQKRVINTIPARMFGQPREWKEAQARAEAFLRELTAQRNRWQAASAAFEQTFRAGHAISAAATEEDVATARARMTAIRGGGNYRVTLHKTTGDGFGVALIAVLTGMTFAEATEVQKSIQYVGPAELERGLTLDAAIGLKNALEPMEFGFSIAEGPPPGTYRRHAIPENVRHEVWKRDGGACVDCGSRDRLEFDHIVPVSKGGANTARNIELRCETCNRAKAAKV